MSGFTRSSSTRSGPARSGLIRIRANASRAREVVTRWQRRFGESGAVHESDPTTLLLTADTSVEALEDLLRDLQGPSLEVEIIWRGEERLEA